ncbi:MAG TPA: hypothetical protein VFW23_18385 [Tepidisphaeraceae bacterium]|nr:hypothetical protein [Tepidisphaeraceae bacterium]
MNRSRRAFASLIAVALLGLVAVTAVALFALASADYRRTQYNQQSAQLRQMLMAGATQVMSQSKAWPTAPRVTSHSIAQPDELARQGGAITFSVLPQMDGTCEAQIIATLGTHRASQVLTLQRQKQKWEITGVQLEG